MIFFRYYLRELPDPLFCSDFTRLEFFVFLDEGEEDEVIDDENEENEADSVGQDPQGKLGIISSFYNPV